MSGYELQEKVRKKLNGDGIKLWLEPYSNGNGELLEIPMELVTSIATELQEAPHVISEVMEQLRQKASTKYVQKCKFQTTGIATLNVKLAGELPAEISQKEITTEILLSNSGQELKILLGGQIHVDWCRLKVIFNGKIVEEAERLLDQNIKNLSTVMVICLSETEATARKAEETQRKVTQIKDAATLLANKDDDDGRDHYFLQITDQSGKNIDLPPEERKALSLAMTLNEKGRVALKKKLYTEALLLLTEADTEFRKCRSTILDAVDNYALLCLDIAWCYLLLRNINHLPDAEARLRTCDDCFRKSYGPQLERLVLIKGRTGNERALFMRLHLLQGVVQYFLGNCENARALLMRAQTELEQLTVDPAAMTNLLFMGFSDKESRLGLRACENNVALASEYIMATREEREKQSKLSRQEKTDKRLLKRLGKSASGKPYDINSFSMTGSYCRLKLDIYRQLIEMGFPKGAAAEAMRQTDSDLHKSIQVLSETPGLLSLPDPEEDRDRVVSQRDIDQLESLGFDLDRETLAAALRHFDSDVGRTIESLLQNGGKVPDSWIAAASQSGSIFDSDRTLEEIEKERKEGALIKDLMNDISTDLQDDHLDLSLDEEREFLNEYMVLLDSQ